MSLSKGRNRLEAQRVGLALASRTRSAAGTYHDAPALRALVRDAMIQAGLGARDPRTPLADIVPEGGSVLLKPNWVLHRNNSGAGMDCMITHPEFVLAALAEVLTAGAGRVIIADAPIQSAQFDALAPPEWRERVAELGGSTLVEILDFRDTVTTVRGREIRPFSHQRDAERFVRFDLGVDSLLEPVSEPVGCFRNSCYNPDDMTGAQGPGVHQYVLCKEPFEVDVILNLPKLKAHGKAGVTAALKNLVGVNGDKNVLPHHRVGGSALGGDCYEGLKPFKRLAEFFMDAANRRIGRRGYLPLTYAALCSKSLHDGDVDGKWAGNDTTWRMVLDLNRVVQYGRLDGMLADERQRRVYSLTDGIVAGEHNGPLAPEPVSLGAVTFAADSAYADAVHLALMHFDRQRVALVREAFAEMRYSIVEGRPEETQVRCRDVSYTLDEVAARFGRSFRPPDGWRGCM